MKIGEVARAAGVSIDTVRFYEQRGVLPPASRRPSGYREYTSVTVGRIQLARRMQSVGLSLDEIIDALSAHDTGQATCGSEGWRLDAALDRVDTRIAELKALRRQIVSTRAACAKGRCSMTSDANRASAAHQIDPSPRRFKRTATTARSPTTHEGHGPGS